MVPKSHLKIVTLAFLTFDYAVKMNHARSLLVHFFSSNCLTKKQVEQVGTIGWGSLFAQLSVGLALQG